MTRSLHCLLISISLCISHLLSANTVDRNYIDPVELSDTSITISGSQSGLAQLTAECRGALANDRERNGESATSWGFEFGHGWRAELRSANTAFGSIADRRISILTVCNNDTIVARKEFDKGFDPYSHNYNSFILTLNHNGTAEISGGARTPLPLFAFDGVSDAVSSPIKLFANGKLTTSAIVVESTADPRKELDSGMTVDSIVGLIRGSSDRLEAIWDYLDRENDPRFARPGGRYTLATLSDGQGGYTLIYLGGAETNSSEWHPGMIKGTLHPTIFSDNFDLVWHDPIFETISSDIHANITQNAILSLEFPLLKTKMRFSRRPPLKDGW